MRARRTFGSSVGTKLLLAFTGLALFGFLIVHLYGNLLAYLGPASYNEHAHELISNPLIIPAELGLLAIFLMHVVKAIGNVRTGAGDRPAEPVKPVSHFNRSAEAGTYSPMCSSARGTSTASTSRLVNCRRKWSTRGPASRGSLLLMKSWNMGLFRARSNRGDRVSAMCRESSRLSEF